MKLFMQLFGPMLVFVYHCFDRIVINGYLSVLSRPENVVCHFREVLGIRKITKEVLFKRTRDYQTWVESFARNHNTPMQWAQKGVREEEYVRPDPHGMKRKKARGVYFIFKSMERGPTFRSRVPKYATDDPDYRIIKKHRSRYTHYYFYIRDLVLGPMVMRVGSFFPFQTTYYLNGHNFMEIELGRLGVRFRKKDNAFLSTDDPCALQRAADSLTPDVIRERLDYWTFVLGPKFSKRERKRMNLSRFYAVGQVEYCRNFIFKRNFPIRKIFERGCEIGLWRLTADRISQIFGVRITKKLKGKLMTTLDKIEHGRHTLRAYWKNSFVKQYEKFRTFLRQEAVSNDLSNFRLRKGLDNLPEVRGALSEVVERFTALTARSFSVHADFPLFQRLAKTVTIGKSKIPGIRLHDARVPRQCSTPARSFMGGP